MATSRRRWLMAGLLLLPVLGTGCNMMALPYFLMPGEPKIDARCKLVSDDKEKEVRVVILASNGLVETRPEFLRVDSELSRLLAQRLQEAFKQNKEKVTVVPNSRVEKYKDEHPGWQKSLSAAEIGAYFNADYVINLEINSVSLYEPGSINTLFRGRAAISIDVVNVHKHSEGPIYQEEYSVEYPRAQGPIPADGSSPVQFRQRFLAVVAKELSWRFTSHLVDDDYKCD